MTMDQERWVPEPTPETQPFWDAAWNGRLSLPHCADCNEYFFPPRTICPNCQSRNVAMTDASGRGSLLSYVISHLSVPGFDAPYSIAVVKLEEGPTMLSNIVDCDQTPDALELDMPLEAVFTPISETISLPQFRPAGGTK